MSYRHGIYRATYKAGYESEIFFKGGTWTVRFLTNNRRLLIHQKKEIRTLTEAKKYCIQWANNWGIMPV